MRRNVRNVRNVRNLTKVYMCIDKSEVALGCADGLAQPVYNKINELYGGYAGYAGCTVLQAKNGVPHKFSNHKGFQMGVMHGLDKITENAKQIANAAKAIRKVMKLRNDALNPGGLDGKKKIRLECEAEELILTIVKFGDWYYEMENWREADKECENCGCPR